MRFPKKKKLKTGEAPEPVAVKDEAEVAGPVDLSDPRTAAKERAKRRGQMTTQLFTEDGEVEVEVAHISAAEVQYQVFLLLSLSILCLIPIIICMFSDLMLHFVSFG